ncbi:MAG: hypothetical protein IKS27_02360 [Oscillospiraceae bacterium]|nr:hypothetical protein [Oscillospiraceae bacterium]
MPEEFMVSGYCRVIDGNRILVCEPDGNGGVDTGCKYPRCDFAPVCKLIQSALEQAASLWSPTGNG